MDRLLNPVAEQMRSLQRIDDPESCRALGAGINEIERLERHLREAAREIERLREAGGQPHPVSWMCTKHGVTTGPSCEQCLAEGKEAGHP